MQSRGIFSLIGAPFLKTFVRLDGIPLCPLFVTENKLGFWVPRFEKRYEQGVATQTVLAPIEGKGFLVHIEYENTSNHTQKITLGFDGEWENTKREINTCDELSAKKTLTKGWHDAPVYALNNVLPIFCFSFLCNEKTGLLLPKDTTVAEDIELIKKFISMPDEQYHQYQINCVKFYNENLSMEIFTKK